MLHKEGGQNLNLKNITLAFKGDTLVAYTMTQKLNK